MQLTEFDDKNMKVSSKRIATKTGKVHSNVLRDIRNMLDELALLDSKLNSSEYKIVTSDKTGLTTEIELNERLSLCLGSGYSISLRMAIIDDWAELKATNNTGYSMPKTFSEALRQLAESVEAKEAMEKQLEAAKPKIEFFNAVTGSKDAEEMSKVAKVLDLGIGRNKLFAMLRDLKILRYDNEPYQEYIDRGYFRVIEQKYTDSKGETHIVFKTLVYQKGLKFIREKILKLI